MNTLSLRSAFVTGAGRRIGAALALTLGRRGWFVGLHSRNDSQGHDAAAAVLASIRAAGGDGIVVCAELADPQEATAALDAVAAVAPAPISVLVNNASRFVYDDAATMTRAGWHAHLAVNLETPVLLTQRMMARLPATATGTVVNLLDQKLTNLNPDYFSYTVSKAGLKAVTELLSMSYGGRLQSCGIAPGLTLPSPRQTAASFARAHRDTPLGRSSTVEDLVYALDFILDTPTFTGQVLVIDGGESLVRRPRDVAFDPRLEPAVAPEPEDR